MYNCCDTTFIIPVKIDSIDRVKNIYIVVKFLKTFFNSPIIIIEQDNNLCETQILSCFDGIKYFYFNVADQYIRKCSMINIGVLLSKTSIVAIQDSDVFTSPEQYMSSIDIVRSKEADCSLPYDGVTWQISTIDFDKILPYFDFDIINNLYLENITPKVYNGPSNNGILFFDKYKLINSGMYNEKFKGWGNENDEIYHRFGTLNNKYKRAKGDLFHLSHYRTPELYGYAPGNREEYVRVFNLSPYELRKDINTRTITIPLEGLITTTNIGV